MLPSDQRRLVCRREKEGIINGMKMRGRRNNIFNKMNTTCKKGRSPTCSKDLKIGERKRTVGTLKLKQEVEKARSSRACWARIRIEDFISNSIRSYR